MHRATLWLGVLAFAAGIASAQRHPTFSLVPAAAVLGAAGLCVRDARSRLVAVLTLAFSCGSCLALVHVSRAVPIEVLARSYPRCRIEGTVSQRTSIGTFIKPTSGRCSGRPLPAAGEIVVVDAAAELGARLAVEGWLVPLEEDGIEGARRRAGGAASFTIESIQERPPRGGFAAAAIAVRRSLRRATHGRRATTAGLLQGLAIGETDRLPPGPQEELRRAGLSHLVAVSGTNVTIVLASVALIAGRVSRRARSASCCLALALFVAVVGPDPSVLRAAAMGAVGLVAVLVGTRSSPLDALALAIVAVLAVRPQMVHSAGLHLSVAATAGICLWAATLERRIRIGPRWLRTALAVTVSAQLAVAPLLALTFGELSLVGIPANVLAAPAVAPATIAALGAALLGLVSDTMARGVIAVASPFADWIAFVGERFGSNESASIAVPRGLGTALAVAGIVVIWISTWRADRARRPVPASPQIAGTVR
jgi:competence protein ComEC